MNGSFFSIIMLAMAVYVLISGITGKGKLFAVEGVPEEKLPKFKKILRILYVVMGLFMTLNTGLSYLRDQMYQPVAVEQTAATAEATAEPAAEATAAPAEATEAPAAEATAAPVEATTEPAAEATAAPVVATTSSGYEIVRTDKFPRINISYKALNVLAFVMLGITMAAVVGMFVVINKFVDKEAARKAAEEKGKQGGARRGGRDSQPAMPKGAFEFDDEPEEKSSEE